MKTRTPKLYNVLRRLLAPEELAEAGRIFSFTQETGGEDELGFKRPVDQSFNPRLARIPLILAGEEAECRAVVLCAAILSCSQSPDAIRQSAVLLPEGMSTVVEIALLARRSVRQILDSNAPFIESALAIAGAKRLDYVRHLHLVINGRNVGDPWSKNALSVEDPIWRRELTLNDEVIPLLAERVPRIAQLLQCWNERERSRLDKVAIITSGS